MASNPGTDETFGAAHIAAIEAVSKLPLGTSVSEIVQAVSKAFKDAGILALPGEVVVPLEDLRLTYEPAVKVKDPQRNSAAIDRLREIAGL